MSKKDDAAAAYYADPAHRDSEGPGYGLPDRPARLSSHIPVRFDRDTAAVIKQFSDEDGLTVSAWVRHVVDRELQRRISIKARSASTARGILSVVHMESGAMSPVSASAGGRVTTRWSVASSPAASAG